MEFHKLRNWPHWPHVRFVVGFLAALATIAALLFSVSESSRRARDEQVSERLDGTIFGIVMDSRDSGATLAEIKDRYRAMQLLDSQLPPSTEMPDAVFRTVLQRLSGVVAVDDRWYLESAVPLSELQVTIDNIAFGIPPIPDAYTSRALTPEEVDELLSPIRDSGKIIRLSETEADNLNRIIRTASQAGGYRVAAGVTYTSAEVVDHFDSAFRRYYNYTQWEQVAKRWGDFLSRDDLDRVQRINSFVETEVNRAISHPEMLSNIIGMATVRNTGETSHLITFESRPDECVGPRATAVRLIHHPSEPRMVINWAGPTMAGVASLDAPQRVARAEDLVRLFSEACPTTLSRVFYRASEIFGAQHVGMKASLDEWTRIFEARRDASLSIAVTISNGGTFDFYVRREVRAAVGTPGTSNEKEHFDLVADDGVGEEASLPVEARALRTYTFHASPATNLGALYSAFRNELTSSYIRVVIFSSFGGPNDVVVSSVTPFSDEARELMRREVDDILAF